MKSSDQWATEILNEFKSQPFASMDEVRALIKSFVEKIQKNVSGEDSLTPFVPFRK